MYFCCKPKELNVLAPRTEFYCCHFETCLFMMSHRNVLLSYLPEKVQICAEDTINQEKENGSRVIPAALSARTFWIFSFSLFKTKLKIVWFFTSVKFWVPNLTKPKPSAIVPDPPPPSRDCQSPPDNSYSVSGVSSAGGRGRKTLRVTRKVSLAQSLTVTRTSL